MAPKRQQATSPSAAAISTPSTTTTGTSTPTTTISSSTTTAAVALSPKASVAEITQHILNRYFAQTPQRTFLLDAFMVYLVLVGGIQFVYCVVAGNYVRLPSPIAVSNNFSRIYVLMFWCSHSTPS